jgi:O-antigen/teichoic acid export membrane protein
MPLRRASQSLAWLTWSTLGVGAQGVGQFLLLAVLARRLEPEDFGIVTATMIVVGLGRMFIEGSTSAALVQRPMLEPRHVRAGFLISMGAMVVMVALGVGLAPWLEVFFGMPGLASVMRTLALVFVFVALGTVPEALLQRELRLEAIALSDSLSSLVGFLGTGVLLALLDCGIWSLVGAYVAQMLIKAVVLLRARPHERSWTTDPAAAKEILSFSGGVVTARLFNYAAGQADNVIVAKWMSAEALGVYGRAIQLMTMPAMFVGEIITRVLFPALARHQSDLERLRTTYERGIALTACLMGPAAVGGILVAPEIVRTVLGPERWDAVIEPFQILTAALVARMGYKISDALAQATGTVYERAWRQAVFAALVVIGTWYGMDYGVAGVARGYSLAIVANYLLAADLSRRTTGLPWRRFFVLHGRGVVLAALFGLVVWGAATGLRAYGASSPSIVLLALLVPTGLAALAALRYPGQVLGPAGDWLSASLRGRG